MSRRRPPGYNSNAARARRRAARNEELTNFVGVDGEGWTDENGVHYYAQLSVGDRTLFGADHLDFLDIAEFLCTCYEEDGKDGHTSYVGFYLGYDFSMWFRSLPAERARMLLSKEGIASRRRINSGGNTIPFPVRYGGFEFDILGDKRFKIRREMGALGDDEQGADNPWMYINDAGPFFQCSFLTAINPQNWPDGSPCSPDQYATILEGKSHRADAWTRDTWLSSESSLTRYNVTENLVLASVMQRYEAGLRASGVRLKKDQWYGPGQAAQEWMKKEGVTYGSTVQARVGPEILDFARESYYGGRFEVFAHGIVPGLSYEYDINSAYPWAMAIMPAWEEAGYEWATDGQLTEELWRRPFALLDCTTAGSDPVAGGLAHRRKDDTIYYPLKSRGVRWSFEVLAAMEAGLVDSVEVHRAVLISPAGDSVLSERVPQMYQQRKDVGKNTSHGKGIKLVLNSLYGKQAQSIGSPKFSNALAASFITAWCRTMILTAIATHPTKSQSLLMIATDGVYFADAHPYLDVDKERLGAWDATEKPGLTIVMPGVHYDDKGRELARNGEYAKLKSRGIPAAGLAASLSKLDEGFTALREAPHIQSAWPTLSIPIKFQVTSPRLALHQGKWERAGTVARDVERNLSTAPNSKRLGPMPSVLNQYALEMDLDLTGLPYTDSRGTVRTFPYPGEDGISKPYEQRFGLDEGDRLGGYSPDGPMVFDLFDLVGNDGQAGDDPQ